MGFTRGTRLLTHGQLSKKNQMIIYGEHFIISFGDHTQSFMVMVTSIGKINRIAGRHIFCQVAHHHHPRGLAERLPSAVFRKFETNC